MKNKLILYQLFTEGLGNYYVVAPDPYTAEQKLKEKLDNADYGLFQKRKVHRIDIICKSVDQSPITNKPDINTDENRLIIDSYDKGS